MQAHHQVRQSVHLYSGKNRFLFRDLRDSSQPLSGEYLTSDDLKEDTDSCSSQYPSLGGHGSHSESVYEVGRDLESLSQSLEDLDTDLKRPPVLVQVSARSQPRLDTASGPIRGQYSGHVTTPDQSEARVSHQQPLVAQYSVRSEVGAVKMRPRLITTSSEPQHGVLPAHHQVRQQRTLVQ